jgi:thiol:disulfide interchange protein DsbA
MKRREFSLGTAAALAASGLALPAHGPGPKPEDGQGLLTLDKRVPPRRRQGKVEVIEFFWYSCPHCNAFEPKLEAWIKKPRPMWWCARAGGLPRRVRAAAAPVLHAGSHGQAGRNARARCSPPSTPSASRWTRKRPDPRLGRKTGVDKAKFQELYNSFSVATKVRRATQLQDA